jgi:HAD superfamily hydrolase (TIGR01509 family)
MPFYTYIMLCDDGSYYTGHTDDVEKRFKLHQQGFGGHYTLIHRPREVLYVEEFATRSEAAHREREIKHLGRNGRRKLIRTPFENVEWVFFDFGSTLTDEGVFERFMFREVYRFLITSGFQVTRRRFNRSVKETVSAAGSERVMRGSRYKKYGLLLAATVKRLPGGEKVVPQVLEHYVRNIRPHYAEKQRLKPGVKSLLNLLKKGYRLGVIANRPVETRALLKRFGLERYFDVVVLSDEAGATKPSEKIFAIALERASCPPEKAVMIGDRLDNDVVPAKKLGMKTIRIKFGLTASQKPLCEFEKADCSLFNLKNLLEVL